LNDKQWTQPGPDYGNNVSAANDPRCQRLQFVSLLFIILIFAVIFIIFLFTLFIRFYVCTHTHFAQFAQFAFSAICHSSSFLDVRSSIPAWSIVDSVASLIKTKAISREAAGNVDPPT